MAIFRGAEIAICALIRTSRFSLKLIFQNFLFFPSLIFFKIGSFTFKMLFFQVHSKLRFLMGMTTALPKTPPLPAIEVAPVDASSPEEREEASPNALHTRPPLLIIEVEASVVKDLSAVPHPIQPDWKAAARPAPHHSKPAALPAQPFGPPASGPPALLRTPGRPAPLSAPHTSGPPPPPPPGPPPPPTGLKGGPAIKGKSGALKNLRPFHWVKVTRAMQGSLWADAPKSDNSK